MGSNAIRIYTLLIGLICGLAVAWTLDQQHAAASAQADARRWQQLAVATVAHDRATTRKNHKLVRQYNTLVSRTTRSQHRLLQAMQEAQAQSTAAQQATVYRTVSGGTVYVPSSSKSAAPTPAPVTTTTPPVTRTS
jgi:hypothetical protein